VKPVPAGGFGDTDEVIAGRALDLRAGELRFALQRLVAMGAIEFEFVGADDPHLHHAQSGRKRQMRDFSILYAVGYACRIE
jgi:hypothetical protein